MTETGANTSQSTLRQLIAFLAVFITSVSVHAEAASKQFDFASQIEPLLVEHCFDCHGDGMDRGGLAIDHYQTDPAFLKDTSTWLAVWRKLDTELMPPPRKSKLSETERRQLQEWIVRDVFALDPANPKPGKTTVRRLNRTEYQNTVRDWLGINYPTAETFPPDDTGYGFDNIGDVLSISPLLMEKYLDAAQDIAGEFIRKARPKVPVQNIAGEEFVKVDDPSKSAQQLVFREPASATKPYTTKAAGRYRLTMDFRVTGSEEATTETADLALSLDGVTLNGTSIGWDNRQSIQLAAETVLTNGTHDICIQITPGRRPLEDENHLALSVTQVRIEGPLDGSAATNPPEYRRLLPEGPPPKDRKERARYVERILRPFADRAFRRPVDRQTLQRLVEVTMTADQQPGTSFEQALGQALTAILASPRFLFHAEQLPTGSSKGKPMPVDEFALASRLSYFLWNSLPDAELFELARTKALRGNLTNQIERMLADRRSDRFIESFVGQWLQVRDVDAVAPDAKRILNSKDNAQREVSFDYKLRTAMKQETEMLFADLLRNGGTLTDLLTTRESFLNEPLAEFYDVPDVKGGKMRKVSFPESSPRAGVLTHASVLLVTSNPTRTSPVKRGLFILDNLLGTPPPPPPPDIPPLEDARKTTGKSATMRELMVAHREKPLCASCHEQMDPLGLAFEHYNALGGFRETENGRPIDTTGALVTGEQFADGVELANILTTARRHDLYRCVTEKMLTYALGRGLEYYDLPTIMDITAQLERDHGRLKTLLYAVISSAPFQMQQSESRLEARTASANHANQHEP